MIKDLERKGYVVDGRLYSSAFADFVRQQARESPPEPGTSPDAPVQPGPLKRWLGRLSGTVLDELIAVAILSVLAYGLGRLAGFLTGGREMWVYVAASVVVGLLLLAGYTLWQRRRG